MIKTKIMGILNITPDSFYDGHINYLSDFNYFENKIKSFKKADIIDIGCESSRPGANKISLKNEMERISIINKFRFDDKILSIDSYKPQIIEYCLNKGFKIVNDISGGGKKFKNIDLAKKYSSKIVLMHMLGSPENMQENPKYNNIIDDLNKYFDKRVSYCINIGMSLDDIILDPGIGFGKTIEDNDTILLNIKEFKHFKCKILLGVSRKSFLKVDNDSPSERLYQSIGVNALSAFNGVDIVRVHDVKETYKTLKIIDRIKAYG